MIRISVVAGSPVVRAGLRALLEEGPGVEVVDSLAPEDADQARGEVLVFDAEPDTLPPLDAEGPLVVLLTDDPDGVRQSELWPSRVRAVLPHSAPVADIVAAVQAVAVGFVLLRPEEAGRAHVPPRAATTSSFASWPNTTWLPSCRSSAPAAAPRQWRSASGAA